MEYVLWWNGTQLEHLSSDVIGYVVTFLYCTLKILGDSLIHEAKTALETDTSSRQIHSRSLNSQTRVPTHDHSTTMSSTIQSSNLSHWGKFQTHEHFLAKARVGRRARIGDLQETSVSGMFRSRPTTPPHKDSFVPAQKSRMRHCHIESRIFE